MRALDLSLPVVLSGCSVFETILEGLGRFVDANDDGPRFVYADNAVDPIIRFAAITPDDTGLPLASNRLGIPGATVLALRQSPSAHFGGGGWDLVFSDVSDFGLFVFNGETGAKELLVPDNNITLPDELACKIPEIAEATRAAIAPLLDGFFPGLTLDPATFAFDVAIEDNPGNFLGFVGWTADNRLIGRYEYENDITIIVPDPGFDITADDWTPPRIRGRILSARQSDGSWVADACPPSFPPAVTVLPERDVTLVLSGGGFPRTGDIFLDGARLPLALGSGFLTRGRTTHLSGAW